MRRDRPDIVSRARLERRGRSAVPALVGARAVPGGNRYASAGRRCRRSCTSLTFHCAGGGRRDHRFALCLGLTVRARVIPTERLPRTPLTRSLAAVDRLAQSSTTDATPTSAWRCSTCIVLSAGPESSPSPGTAGLRGGWRERPRIQRWSGQPSAWAKRSRCSVHHRRRRANRSAPPMSFHIATKLGSPASTLRRTNSPPRSTETSKIASSSDRP